MEEPGHHPPICRINDLPYDTLYIIFVICWKDATNMVRAPRRRVIHSKSHWPVIASHVCRLWRQHALDTPVFWSYIQICESIPRLEMYHEWLARVKNAPFDVYIGWKPFAGASVKHAKAIMRLIMPHISHLRSLYTAYIPLKILQLILNRLSDANAPLLERVRLAKLRSSSDNVPESPRKKINIKLFQRGQVPSLKEVQLDGLPYDYVTAHFGESLSTFKISPRTELATPQDDARLAQRILSQSPGLRVFGFFGLIGVRRTRRRHALPLPNLPLPNSPLPPVHHASLQEIYIKGNQRTKNMIMCSLILPRIRYFLDNFKDELPLGLSCLHHIGLGSFPSLISLRLQGNTDSWGATNDPRDLMHLSTALETLPELRALTFQNVDFGNDGCLIKCLGAAKCCPRLQWLTLLQCCGYTLHELRSVVEARRRLKNVGPLVRVTVYEWPSSTSNIYGDDEAREWLGQTVDFRMSVSYDTEDPEQNYLRVVEGVQRGAVTTPSYHDW